MIYVINLPSPSLSPWYLDVLKTAAGALAGAMLAFLFAVLHRWMQERNTNLSAGNLALFQLRAIYRRIGDLRLCVRHDIVDKRRIHPDAPLWILIRPLLLVMDDIEAFNLGSLSFLLSNKSGQNSIKHVRHVEEIFFTLKNLLALHQDTALEFQKSTVDLRRVNPHASWEEIEEHVGAELIARRISYFNALLQHAEKDPTQIKNCFLILEESMQERFKAKVWKLDFDFVPTSSRAEPNLPPLPEDIQELVASFPA